MRRTVLRMRWEITHGRDRVWLSCVAYRRRQGPSADNYDQTNYHVHTFVPDGNAISKLLITVFAARLAKKADPDKVIIDCCNPAATKGTAFMRDVDSEFLKLQSSHILLQCLTNSLSPVRSTIRPRTPPSPQSNAPSSPPIPHQHHTS
jgi:hypothetical protein